MVVVTAKTLAAGVHVGGLGRRCKTCYTENTVPVTVADITFASSITEPLRPVWASHGRQRQPDSRATTAMGRNTAKQTSQMKRQDQTSSFLRPCVRLLCLSKTIPPLLCRSCRLSSSGCITGVSLTRSRRGATAPLLHCDVPYAVDRDIVETRAAGVSLDGVT